MEIELIEGMEDGETKFGKVAYSCPNCHILGSWRVISSTRN